MIDPAALRALVELLTSRCGGFLACRLDPVLPETDWCEMCRAAAALAALLNEREGGASSAPEETQS